MSYPVTCLTRYGGWLPSKRVLYQSFVDKHVRLCHGPRNAKERHTPAVEKFEKAIRDDPEMLDLFNQIFLQAAPENQIPDFETLLYMIDRVVVAAPKFHIAKDEQGEVIGEPIGVPLYLPFDVLSNTSAAYDLFRKPAFNAALKDLLDSWGQYLASPGSNSTLTDGDEGWFSGVGLASLEQGRGVFNETYVTPDPNAINRGYQSWDEFFTREIQEQARPVDKPEDKRLIHSACESTVYRIERNVQLHDRFWLKSQDYSLYDMLDRDDDMASRFIGGTVYQAFLSPQDYHRWRSPVDGVIKKTKIVPGTYYAVLPDEGAPKDDPDLKPGEPYGALIRSQAWLTVSSARALIYIEAKNANIGLVGFIGVGMAEVSSVTISVQEGQEVKTGDEIGMFHFGGSSHALLFGPQAKVEFFDHVKVDKHLWVNSIIAHI